MPLGGKSICTLAACAAASLLYVAAAAAQSPASWAQCASLDIRQADQAIAACSGIIAASGNDPGAAATAHGYRGAAQFRRHANPQDLSLIHI